MSEIKEFLKDLIDMAEDGYKLHVRNACHKEFLLEDRECMSKAKAFLKRLEPTPSTLSPEIGDGGGKNSIPSQEENPTGFHRRYIVSKASGEPVDKGAEYIVLRLDWGGDDKEHIRAGRIGAVAYANAVGHHLPEMAADLKARYADSAPSTPTADTGEVPGDVREDMQVIKELLNAFSHIGGVGYEAKLAATNKAKLYLKKHEGETA